MADQADDLRRLVRERAGAAVGEAPRRRSRACSLVFAGGKGGAGTSNLALNLAIALGDYGKRVVLVDADLGLANIDLLCGLSPSADLGDVLDGSATLEEAVVDGPGSIRIVAGAHGSRTLDAVLASGASRLSSAWSELESTADFLIVDAGSGLGPSLPILAGSADEAVVVTTPEPTSLADAHAILLRLDRRVEPGRKPARLRAVVNQTRSAAEGRAVLEGLTASSRQFLGAVVTPLGHVRGDPRVPISVRRREPFLTAFPRSIASRCVRRLARRLIEEGRGPRPATAGIFASLSRTARSILPSPPESGRPASV